MVIEGGKSRGEGASDRTRVRGDPTRYSKRTVSAKTNPDLRVDRSAFSVVRLGEQNRDDREYWLGKTPQERLQGVETIRQILYGYDPSERLQRVLEVAEQE